MNNREIKEILKMYESIAIHMKSITPIRIDIGANINEEYDDLIRKNLKELQLEDKLYITSGISSNLPNGKSNSSPYIRDLELLKLFKSLNDMNDFMKEYNKISFIP